MKSLQNEHLPRVAILGGGVHAVVVADCIRAAACGRLVGYFDQPGHDASHMRRMDVPYLGDDSQIRIATIDAAILGMAGIEHTELRRKIVARASVCVPTWFTAVHPRATIAEQAVVSEGVAVFAGAVVNSLARIGAHAVVNTGAIVEHHVVVEDFAVVSPHATLCGCVHVGEAAFIGAGAVVITGISIGANSIVGAGAIVIRDVPDGVVVVGNPARILDRRINLGREKLAALMP